MGDCCFGPDIARSHVLPDVGFGIVEGGVVAAEFAAFARVVGGVDAGKGVARGL